MRFNTTRMDRDKAAARRRRRLSSAALRSAAAAASLSSPHRRRSAASAASLQERDMRDGIVDITKGCKTPCFGGVGTYRVFAVFAGETQFPSPVCRRYAVGALDTIESCPWCVWERRGVGWEVLRCGVRRVSDVEDVAMHECVVCLSKVVSAAGGTHPPLPDVGWRASPVHTS